MTNRQQQADERASSEHGRVDIRRLDQPGDLGWVIQTHGEVYAREYGWDTSFETLVAQIVADFASGHDPDHEAAWIAELDGRRAGCIFCVAGEDDTAKLRILLVDPSASGHGLGGARLVRTCLDFARDVGCRRMTLWTNDVLTSARRIYQATGFTLVDEEPPPQLRPRPRRADLDPRPLSVPTPPPHACSPGGTNGRMPPRLSPGRNRPQARATFRYRGSLAGDNRLL